MPYWRPAGKGFVPGVPMTNYSDAAMSALEAQHPGIKEGGGFVRVDEPMPGDEPHMTPSAVAELASDEDGSDDNG